ncbi:phage holin family protein [Undibacterium fentianense]|uniref:Phage holin family protein n=1 Tax=Undibacterium fentianense TaxID=2828728 RepID=A0A941E4F4_9BURK|nr:phage holin family protein [Undibacterium fentianense]MBR7800937.1 phage holin family protein [Undibacterium fentianense]
MAITDSIARFGASLLDSLHTRLELASIEVEEEFGRYANYLVLILAALFCGIVSLLLLILFVLILFWDTHRELALSCMLAVFSISTVAIIMYLRSAIRQKPRFLSASLKELRQDIASLRQSAGMARPNSNEGAEDNEGF